MLSLTLSSHDNVCECHRTLGCRVSSSQLKCTQLVTSEKKLKPQYKLSLEQVQSDVPLQQKVQKSNANRARNESSFLSETEIGKVG